MTTLTAPSGASTFPTFAPELPCTPSPHPEMPAVAGPDQPITMKTFLTALAHCREQWRFVIYPDGAIRFVDPETGNIICGLTGVVWWLFGVYYSPKNYRLAAKRLGWNEKKADRIAWAFDAGYMNFHGNRVHNYSRRLRRRFLFAARDSIVLMPN